MGVHAILLVFVVCYHLLFYGTVRCNWNLSKDEDFNVEKQLKYLNKPSLRTIVNKYGDVYDCVDFYKQLAFDHHLLKNQTLDFQINSFSIYNKTKKEESLEAKVCPVGSVPIRRITKDDLIRDKKIDTTNRPGTYLAIARTKRGRARYGGAVGFISLHNPKILPHQFSTTRIKLQNGPNSIEAGWRVDPTLYGDTRTRLFVRTDAGGSHCFNLLCPGYVHTNREIPIDIVFSSMSVPGGPSYELPIQIIRDNGNGNWNLIIGRSNTHMGFWPSRIFTGLVNYIEWGGAVYSPPALPLPQMGSGSRPVGDTFYDGYIAKLQVVNQRGQILYANNIEINSNYPHFYPVYDLGQRGADWGHLILYGGPRNRKAN